MTVSKHCTAECTAMPECVVCGRTKHPRGRDPGVNAASGYCAHECPGHSLDPQAGHLWPSEWRDYLIQRAHEAGDHSGCDDCGADTPRPRRGEGG